MIKQQDQLITFDVYLDGIFQHSVMDRQKLTIGNLEIKVQDMLGLILKSQDADNQFVYSLYTYPKRKKIFRSQKRYLQELVLMVRCEREQWKKKQKRIIYRINNREEDSPLKLLICFNPNAGSNSKKHLTNILNFMRYTNLSSEVLTTTGRNHCLEYLKKIQYDGYCAVAIVSGDGLMHEFVNSFCPLPVTHVPAGSGNAFSKTQTQLAGELCKDQQSIFLVVRNRTKKFNLVKYQLEKLSQPIYSFLSLEWAIIADLDLNSQHLRFLGGFRFELYGFWLVLRMKKYFGRVTYSTIQSQMPSLQIDLKDNPNYVTVQDTFLQAIFCTIPYISDKHKIAPLIRQQQRFIDMQTVNEQNGRCYLAKYMIASDSGSHFNKQLRVPAEGYKFVYNKIKSYRIQPLDVNQPGKFGIDGEAYESQRIQGSFSDRTFLAFV